MPRFPDYLRRTFSVLLLLLLSSVVHALQPGELDSAFNVADIGHGNGDGFQVIGGSTSYTLTTATQPDGKVLVGGVFTTYHGQIRNRLARLNPDGTLDPLFAPSFDAEVKGIAVQADGKILVGGPFTVVNGSAVRKYIVRLNPDGTTDTSFNTGTVTSQVTHVRVLPDGNILIAGQFSKVGGINRARMARLLPSGAVDAAFDPGTGPGGGDIHALLIQPDGKLLVGGDFTSFGTTPSYTTGGVVRLNENGAVDSSFVAKVSGDNGTVISMVLQPDGKVVIAGQLTYAAGVAIGDVVRLNSDGSLDSAFAANTLNTAFPWDGQLVLRLDGRLLVGGSRNAGPVSLQSLNADGTVDATFPGTTIYIAHLALQPDGKLLIGGAFYEAYGLVRGGLVRLNADNTPDASFHSVYGANSAVNRVVVQSDGKMVMAGTFTAVNDRKSPGIVRLQADGSVDAGFTVSGGPAPAGSIKAVVVQPDGKVMVGGSFSSFSGAAYTGLVRLNASGAVDLSYAPGALAVRAMVLLDDGKLLVAHPNGVKRYNTDGSVDASFDTSVNTGLRINTNVLVPAPDGKWLVTGWVYSGNAFVRKSLMRLLPDGALDMSFDVGEGDSTYEESQTASVAVQPDGRILVGGSFTTFNGIARPYLLRLNADGSIDNTFNTGSGPNGAVNQIILQPDGKILIGGAFSYVNGVLREQLARLNQDGSLDTGSFGLTGTGAVIKTMAVRADGRLVAGGTFTSYCGIGRNRFMQVGTGDADMDGIEDAADAFYDPDSDGDGVANGEDAFPYDPLEWLDTDGDWMGNNADPDDDGDFVLDVIDAAPLDSLVDTMLLDGIYRGAMAREQQVQ